MPAWNRSLVSKKRPSKVTACYDMMLLALGPRKSEGDAAKTEVKEEKVEVKEEVKTEVKDEPMPEVKEECKLRTLEDVTAEHILISAGA